MHSTNPTKMARSLVMVAILSFALLFTVFVFVLRGMGTTAVATPDAGHTAKQYSFAQNWRLQW